MFIKHVVMFLIITIFFIIVLLGQGNFFNRPDVDYTTEMVPGMLLNNNKDVENFKIFFSEAQPSSSPEWYSGFQSVVTGNDFSSIHCVEGNLYLLRT